MFSLWLLKFLYWGVKKELSLMKFVGSKQKSHTCREINRQLTKQLDQSNYTPVKINNKKTSWNQKQKTKEKKKSLNFNMLSANEPIGRILHHCNLSSWCYSTCYKWKCFYALMEVLFVILYCYCSYFKIIFGKQSLRFKLKSICPLP